MAYTAARRSRKAATCPHYHQGRSSRRVARAFSSQALAVRAPKGCNRATFLKQGGVGYVTDLLPAQTHAELVAMEAEWRKTSQPEQNSLARGRLGRHLSPQSPAHEALMSEWAVLFLSNLVGEPLYPGDFPLEYRLCATGSDMEWHRDTIMYEQPQYELVYTLSNDSDARTEWRLPDGRVHSQHMAPNSLLVLRAGGPLHRVTPASRGTRGILKAVMRTSVLRTEAWFDSMGTYDAAAPHKKKKAAARASLAGGRRRQ